MLTLALAAAVVLQTPGTVETYGRDVLTAGVCSSLGWVVNNAEGERLGQSLMRANPQLTRAQFEAAATSAGTLAGQEIQRDLAAVTDRAGFQTWANAIEARCDGIATAYPALLQQGPGTAEAWERTKTRLSAKYSQ